MIIMIRRWLGLKTVRRCGTCRYWSGGPHEQCRVDAPYGDREVTTYDYWCGEWGQDHGEFRDLFPPE